MNVKFVSYRRAFCLLFEIMCIFCSGGFSAETNTNDSTLAVGKRTVISAWQSSWLNSNAGCFWKRSAEEMDQIANTDRSYLYFHSHDQSSTDAGYHWFLVQLNSSVHINFVSIAGRNDSASHVYNRSAGIEIWTAAKDTNFNSSEHCKNRNISNHFNSTRSEWRMCGITTPKNGRVQKGEILTVNCTALVTMLLLRQKDSINDGYLSFAGISLGIGQPITEPDAYSKETNFTVIGIIVAGCAGAVVFVILLVLLAGIFAAKSRSTRNNHVRGHYGIINDRRPIQIPSNDTYAIADTPLVNLVDETRVASEAPCECSYATMEGDKQNCDYSVLMPLNDDCVGDDEGQADDDCGSECTLYLSIVKDG